MKVLKLLTVLLCIGLCFGCSKSEDEAGGGVVLKPTLKNKVEGKIEKGPFLTGSKVTLYELGSDLKQTGKNIFKTETTDDNGSFAFDSQMKLTSQYVELEINGYFYNEIKGRRSDSQITLNAIADISGKDKVNVNILTHLEYKRVKVLVNKGLSFENAKKQAEQELLKTFCITTEIKIPDNISFTDGDENASILLAVSAILLDDRNEAEFSEFMAKLGNEFSENGTITNKVLLDEIHNSQKNVDADAVKKNLINYYKNQGRTVDFSNISKYIDRNGDGVLDEKDVLDEKPDDVLTEDEFFSSEENFRLALTSSYSDVSSYFQIITVLDAMICKQIDENMIIDSDNQTVMDAWRAAYKAMRMLNFLIEKGTSISKFDVKPHVATAKTMRAMIYLDMVQHWGNVPFLTKVINDTSDPDIYMPRTDKEKIYGALLSDLEVSSSYLKENVEQSQCILPKDLAYVLMATIQMEKAGGNMEVAGNYLKTILNSGRYALTIDNSIYNTLNSKEALFSLLFNDTDLAGNGNLYYLFDRNLKRGNYHPVYRITGIALNYAEILLKENKKAELMEIINKVRKAKGLPAINDMATPAKEISKLWNEIIGTDYGYFALLKRMKLAVELLGIQDYQQLYPIPLTEVQLNPNMVQNPGYNQSDI